MVVRNLEDARLYFVCGASPGGRPLADVLAPALANGVDVFQLREKGAPDEQILAAAEVARALCDDAGVPFILNDRPDLVEETGADGVHGGQDDQSPVSTRGELEHHIIGLSTHSAAQIDRAQDLEIDYFAVGPVYATPTKEGRPAIGLDPVRHAARTAVLPWFAIGGIDAGTLPAVLDAGARRVVVVRAIAEADDPGAAARELREALDGAA
jgi:thiamine-phosphate pyrophosphorylase